MSFPKSNNIRRCAPDSHPLTHGCYNRGMEQTTDAPTWLTTLVAAIVFGGLGVLAYLLYAWQRTGLSAFAQRHGWQYAPDNEVAWQPPACLYEHGRGDLDVASVRHLVYGEVDGREGCLFEFRRFGARDRQVGYTKVMAAYALPSGWINSRGEVLPRGRLGGMLTHTPSLSAEDMVFLKRYAVRGEGEDLGRLFSHPAKRLLLKQYPWVVLFDESHVVLYRPARWWQWSGLRANRAERLLRESRRLYRALTENAPR